MMVRNEMGKHKAFNESEICKYSSTRIALWKNIVGDFSLKSYKM